MFVQPILAAVCIAGQCAANQNAVVWENDKAAFYAYGPGNYHVWTGIDIFNKSVPGPVATAWSSDPALNVFSKHPNIHDNRGEGMDNYTMGAARGVGAVALWADGEWKTYVAWESFELLHAGDDYVEFKLVYPGFSALGKMIYRVRLDAGSRFYRNDVTFEHPERFRKDWRVGPGLDLDPARDHRGDLVDEQGLVSLFELPKGAAGADGSTMTAIVAPAGSDVEMMTDRLNCRVIGFKKASFTYYAGAAWSLAGEVTTAADWHRLARSRAAE